MSLRKSMADQNERMMPVGVESSSYKPSSAYEMSRQKSRLSGTYEKEVERPRKMPSFWHVAGALSMLLIGVIMFIVGATIYWNKLEGQRHVGFDVMIIGAVMIVPGTYATARIYGAWVGWKGYEVLPD